VNVTIQSIVLLVPFMAVGCTHNQTPGHREKLPEEVVADVDIAILNSDQKTIKELVIPGNKMDQYIESRIENIDLIKELNAVASEEFKRSDEILSLPNPRLLARQSPYPYKSRVEKERAWVTMGDESEPVAELAHSNKGWRILEYYGVSSTNTSRLNKAFKDVKERIIAHRYVTWEEARRDLDVRMREAIGIGQ
jgi:hypothetical protein